MFFFLFFLCLFNGSVHVDKAEIFPRMHSDGRTIEHIVKCCAVRSTMEEKCFIRLYIQPNYGCIICK